MLTFTCEPHLFKNLEDIQQVAQPADRDLLIMADFVGYGHFSNPETYNKFFSAISAARDKGVTVRFLICDNDTGLRVVRRQFAPDDSTSHDDLLKLLRHKEIDLAEHLIDKGIEIRILPKEERLFFWVEDDEDAVFSFESVGADDPLCFRTRDAKLIEIFKKIFETNWRVAQPLLLPEPGLEPSKPSQTAA